MWSILEKAVNSSAAALDVVKRDAAEFCRTVSEDTTNFMNGSAESPFGNPKHAHRPHVIPAHGMSSTEVARGCDDIIITSSTYDRQQAQLEHIQNDPDTYCKQPESSADYELWCSTFDLDGHTAEISKVLMKQSVRSHHATLVPGCVMPREFWLRYFYRLHLLKQDDERRAALKAFALQPVENELESWDDEEGWEGGGDWQAIPVPASAAPLPGSGDSVDTVQTSIDDMFPEEPVSATATTLSADHRDDARPCTDAVSCVTPPLTAESLDGSGSPPSSLSLENVADSSTTSSIAAGHQDTMSSSSEHSSGRSSPPSSPPLLAHSPGKASASRNRRPRQSALLKHRQSQGQSQVSPGHSQVASGRAALASSGKWRKPSDVRDARIHKSMVSSSSADDDAADGRDSSYPSYPEVKAHACGRASGYSAATAAASQADSNANDETSGSEIVVLSLQDDNSSQQSLSATSPPCGRGVLVTRFKSAAGVVSPPPSSYGSDFELISETDPSETASPQHRPYNTAAVSAASTGSAVGVAMPEDSLSIVSSDTTLQSMKLATPEKGVNSEEDWESWD